MYQDVFLSFRGEDVRKTFLSHLSRALSQVGISYFQSEKKEMIDRENQISESKVAVVVLSQNYASSTRCLDELSKIMGRAPKKSTTVVPVYYEVDSSDLIHQVEKRGEEVNPETLQRWREALIKLTDTKPSFSSRDSDDESKLIGEITVHVLATISAKSDNLDAMDRHMTYIYKYLDLGSTSEVRVVGISGVSGIGKTTIARRLFEELSSTFQDHCFLETSKNILDHISGTQGIRKRNFLDQGLVRSAASSGSREEHLSTRGRKRTRMQTLSSNMGLDNQKEKIFWRQRVLVIVDNVETTKQLAEIMKDVNCLGSGSRVVVTTRDKSLLSACGVMHIYEVDYLKYDEALELFSEYAFKRQYPPVNFEELSIRAVKLTSCLPLGPKLLGSFLCGKHEKDWEDELQKREAQDEASVESSKLREEARNKKDKPNAEAIAYHMVKQKRIGRGLKKKQINRLLKN